MEPTAFWERSWTASVIRCKRARNPPESHQRRTALRLKARYAELDTGHYPMLSEPEELARACSSEDRHAIEPFCAKARACASAGHD